MGYFTYYLLYFSEILIFLCQLFFWLVNWMFLSFDIMVGSSSIITFFNFSYHIKLLVINSLLPSGFFIIICIVYSCISLWHFYFIALFLLFPLVLFSRTFYNCHYHNWHLIHKSFYINSFNYIYLWYYSHIIPVMVIILSNECFLLIL